MSKVFSWFRSAFSYISGCVLGLFRRRDVPRTGPYALIKRKNVSAKVNVALTYSIEMASSDNPPTSYKLDGLPTGLSYNSATGVVTGTPTVAGKYDVTIEVTRTSGNTYVQSTGVVFEIRSA